MTQSIKKAKRNRFKKYLSTGCLSIIGIGITLYSFFVWKTYQDFPIIKTRLGDSHIILKNPGHLEGYERQILIIRAGQTHRILLSAAQA